jgi:hypothetical protein
MMSGARPHNREKTHCPRGHRYSAENTYVSKEGKRFCKECHRQRMWRVRHGRAEARPAGAGRRGPIGQGAPVKRSHYNRSCGAEDTAGAAERLPAATCRRIITEGPDALALLCDLAGALEQGRTTAVLGLRAAGYTDGQIAAGLGISQQAVSKRGEEAASA